MKKNILIMIAGFVFLGTAITTWVFRKKQKNNNLRQEYKASEPSGSVEAPLANIELSQENNETDKEFALKNMQYRHKEAEAVIRDSVEAICENVKVSKELNNDINRVTDELDKMLNED